MPILNTAEEWFIEGMPVLNQARLKNGCYNQVLTFLVLKDHFPRRTSLRDIATAPFMCLQPEYPPFCVELADCAIGSDQIKLITDIANAGSRMTFFKSMTLRNWRQFASVDIDFHPRLTLLTGSNGAGKSTILNICSQHFGYARPFLSTPRKKKGGGIGYDLGYSYRFDPDDKTDEAFEESFDQAVQEDFEDQPWLFGLNMLEVQQPKVKRQQGVFVEIGSISYDNGVQSSIGFHENQTQSYGLVIHDQQAVQGVPIGSHRLIPAYQPVQGLSLQLANATNAYQAFLGEYLSRLNSGHTQYSPMYRMKESLIAMAAFGEGNRHLEKNTELSEAFDGFTNVLRKILPKELGFQELVVRIPDIVLKTRSGEFVLDAGSGGLTAVIEITWQIYLYSLSNISFVATLDEPENHLHPSMQRSILASLVGTFPQVQFIVATHSPFIVSAVEDSRVFVLRYIGALGQSGFPEAGTRRVRSLALDQASKAGSASEILREVLGVNVTIPEWAETRLERIVMDFEGAEVTPQTLKALRARLSDSGFSEYYPEALARLVDTK